MTLAYDYPLLAIFWSMLLFFLLVAFWVVLFYIVIDIFRSKDLGGIAKAGWLLFVFFFPVIGVLVYLIARGDHIAERAIDTGQARDSRYARYYQGAILTDPARIGGLPVSPDARSRRRNALGAGARVVGLTVLYFVLPFERSWVVATGLVIVLLGLFPFTIRRFARVLHSDHPLGDAITALATTLVTLIIAFAAIYFLIETRNPQSISGIHTKIDSLYFETTVFSTVGFGDIVPVSQATRVLVAGNMLMNMIFLGTTLRLLTWAVQQHKAE